MSRAQLTSTVEQNSAGAAAPVVAGKNFLANGNFDIWQRSTSFSNLTSGAYGADRWCGASSGTSTLSRQTSGAPNGSQYILRSALGAASSFQNIYQMIETANTVALQGSTATLSVKLRRNSTFSGGINVVIEKSSTVDASFGATWTIIAQTIVANGSLPTGTGSSNWYTATATAAIPNDGTANTLRISITQTSYETTGAYWEVSQVQLEQGSVATPFSRAAGTLQGELALCQYYFNRIVNGAEQSDEQICVLQAGSSTSGLGAFKFGNTMRVAPTVTISSASHFGMRGPTFGGPYTCSSLTFASISKRGMQINTAISSGVLTAGYASVFEAPSASATLDLSAEL